MALFFSSIEAGWTRDNFRTEQSRVWVIIWKSNAKVKKSLYDYVVAQYIRIII